MTLSLFKSKKVKADMFSDKKALFDALGKLEPTAVRYLGKKIDYDTRQAAKQARLSLEDAEELVNDAVVITISNIRKGTFPFEDSSPVAYAKGVVRKLIANRLRTKKPTKERLEKVHLASDFNPDKYIQDKERRSIVARLLERLGENCHNLLKMKYFNHLKDQEIITQNLTPYSTVGSLKSKRSQCLKELEQLARQAGIKGVF